MNVKTIDGGNKGLIVWDCFRASFTLLMPTVPHVIECKIRANNYPDKGCRLSFDMFNVIGRPQSSTREVFNDIMEFRKDYTFEQPFSEELMVEHFEKFWDDYINSLEEKS